MSFSNHLFYSTFFSCELRYIMSYFFFIISMIFISLFTTQTNIFEFGSNTASIRFIIIMLWFFLSLFLSRIICYKKKDESKLTNTLFYYDDI